MIVLPWAAVAMCSIFLFFLVIQAHKADLDAYLKHIYVRCCFSTPRASFA